MLGALVCTLVAAIAGGPVQGAVTLAFFLGYQQVENYVIQPRIMKRTVDVSPATVILSAMAGGTLLGPIGVLLAVPGAASIKVVASELMNQDKAPVPRRETLDKAPLPSPAPTEPGPPPLEPGPEP
jgi:predicted PurR-regulated permease PerM